MRVSVVSHEDIVKARQKGREMAEWIGFSATDSVMIAAAISELARNIITYARRGEICIRMVQAHGGRGVEVVATDSGPGIPDLDRVLQGGFSTSGGLGLGLPGVRHLMDDFHAVSKVGRGTTVTARKWIRFHGSN